MNNWLSHLLFWKKVDEESLQQDIKNNIESFSNPNYGDGATEYDIDERQASDPSYSMLHQSYFGVGETSYQNTKELINSYRRTMNIPEVENAVADIVDSAIVHEDDSPLVTLDLTDTNFSDSVKKKIQKEFDNVLKVHRFRQRSTEMFKSWYRDSRIYFHNIIDPENPKRGIIELRRLDPRNLSVVRENIVKEENGTRIVTGSKSYFRYYVGSEGYQFGQRMFAANSVIRIPASAITYAHSNLFDECGTTKNIIGYLHRAIKPANQLKLLEDAVVIYRVSRAPERRVFYIDTGRLPNSKAETVMRSIMNGLKNNATYDPKTGVISGRKNSLSMNEDYWLQRRDGKAVTEVSSLPGASGLNEIEDLAWFNKKLYEALRIPLSRIPTEGGLSFGVGNEITRDELNYMKFIRQLQNAFSPVLLNPLKHNCILKGVLTLDDWEEERENIRVRYNVDSLYEELQDIETMDRRISAVNNAMDLIGTVMSTRTVMRKLLRLTDEEIEEELELIEAERKAAEIENDVKIQDKATLQVDVEKEEE